MNSWKKALGTLSVNVTPCRLTINIHGKLVTDDVASSLTNYLKYARFVTFNIWGELTTNGKAAIGRFSSGNHNANVNLIVHDMILDCSPNGLDFCVDDSALLPSIFTKVKEIGTSELRLTISGVSNDWAQSVDDGLSNSTSLTTLSLIMKSCRGESVGWMQRLLEVLENTSLVTLSLQFDFYSGMEIVIHGLASNKSLHTLILTINNHSGADLVLIEDLDLGLASNKSLHTLVLTINNQSGAGAVYTGDLGFGLASNKSLHTLTLTINNQSGAGLSPYRI